MIILRVFVSLLKMGFRGTGVPPVPNRGKWALTWSWPRRPCHEDPSDPRMTREVAH